MHNFKHGDRVRIKKATSPVEKDLKDLALTFHRDEPHHGLVCVKDSIGVIWWVRPASLEKIKEEL